MNNIGNLKMKLRHIMLLRIGLLSICIVGTVSASENKDTTDVMIQFRLLMILGLLLK